ncbi:MAG TPA: hypothetical protein VGP42_06000 [Stellaceae bacterium]|jgi:hypothetical protein|nr:hypothetical protein [Stellaceae bacterium]
MTLPVLGSVRAPAILDIGPAAEPRIVPASAGATDLVRLFALDRVPAGRQRLVCHWHRSADGRLACIWEPDIVPLPQR